MHDPEMDYGVPEGLTVHMPWLSAFGSHTGKAACAQNAQDLFSDFYDRIKPGEDELWVTSGRISGFGKPCLTIHAAVHPAAVAEQCHRNPSTGR
ncbi:MAG: hypothetical protein R3C09_18730 [Pirellulaceae bacterium]